MANLNRVVYLSEEQKNTLFSTGSVTSGTTTITYSDNDIYITPQEYDNIPTSGSNNLITSGVVYNSISNAPGYNKVGTVTSVQIQATSPVVSSVSATQTESLNTTISLADNYGDSKNPYGTKAANTVLAAPGSSAGTPVFRSLVTDDIPTLSVTKIDMTERRKYYFGLEDDGSWLNITPGVSVPGGNDLNNFTTEGLNAYFTSTSRMVGSFPNITYYNLSHIPNIDGTLSLDKGPGFLKVIRVTSNRIYQLVGLSENIFIRLYNGSEWGSWKELTNSTQSLFSSEVIHAYPDYSNATTPNEYLWETDADYQAFLTEMLEFTGYEYDENLEEYNDLSLGTFLNNFYNFVMGQLQILQETTLQYDFNEEAYPQHYIAGDPEDDYQVATKHYVDQSFAANDAMIFKGTLAGASSTTYTPAANRGDTYKVSTAGLINGEKVEVGDILICITDSTAAATSSNVSTVKNNWTIVQTNLDGAVIGPTTATNNAIALFNNAGNLIKDSAKTITTTTSTSASTDATIPTSKAVWNTVNNYVKKSGDTMTGNLNFSSTASVVLTSAAAAYNSGALRFTSGGVIGGDSSGDIGVYATKIYLRPGNSTTSSGLGIILGTTGSGSSLMTQLDPHATNKVNLGTSSLRYNDIYATNINISKIQAPTQSGGSTYGVGSANQVLKTNGTTVYWGNENIPGSDEIIWNGSNLGTTPSPSNVESAIETVYNAITDTKNTVGATQSTSKVYLVGPTAQSASAQSYSHTAVYAQNGAMAATSYKVAEKVILQYNTTTDALDFVFV